MYQIGGGAWGTCDLFRQKQCECNKRQNRRKGGSCTYTGGNERKREGTGSGQRASERIGALGALKAQKGASVGRKSGRACARAHRALAT